MSRCEWAAMCQGLNHRGASVPGACWTAASQKRCWQCVIWCLANVPVPYDTSNATVALSVPDRPPVPRCTGGHAMASNWVTQRRNHTACWINLRAYHIRLEFPAWFASFPLGQADGPAAVTTGRTYGCGTHRTWLTAILRLLVVERKGPHVTVYHRAVHTRPWPPRSTLIKRQM
jgi:hypothetical protein